MLLCGISDRLRPEGHINGYFLMQIPPRHSKDHTGLILSPLCELSIAISVKYNVLGNYGGFWVPINAYPDFSPFKSGIRKTIVSLCSQINYLSFQKKGGKRSAQFEI